MKNEAMNKTRWIELFRAIGLDDEAMADWHRAFEASYPNGHQSFLEWLDIPAEEIKAIRAA